MICVRIYTQLCYAVHDFSNNLFLFIVLVEVGRFQCFQTHNRDKDSRALLSVIAVEIKGFSHSIYDNCKLSLWTKFTAAVDVRV